MNSKCGQSTIQNSEIWPKLIMPTRCSTQCPKERNFQIFEWNLVELIGTIFGTPWWWWCAKLSWFVKFQKVDNLVFVSKLLLCLFTIWIWARICRGCFGQSGSPWCCLGWGAKSWQSLVWKTSKPGAQRWHQDKIVNFDHYCMWVGFEFKFDSIWVSLIPKLFISV